MEIRLFRYRPEQDEAPFWQNFNIEIQRGMMLRDILIKIRDQDESFAFRHSCGEGVCGSDAVNVNGQNYLACITPVSQFKSSRLVFRPLPGRPVIRDLIVDMNDFYHQYETVQPWLQNDQPAPEKERLQTPEQRQALDGLWECILCGCCSTACPSFWWNPKKFLGPQALLTACRFLLDSRDQSDARRLDQLDDAYRLFRCHTIMNCVEACPKGLNPTQAIGWIRHRLLHNYF